MNTWEQYMNIKNYNIMNIEKLMSHHTEGGRMIRNFNGKKEYILSEEDMQNIFNQLKISSVYDNNLLLINKVKEIIFGDGSAQERMVEIKELLNEKD